MPDPSDQLQHDLNYSINNSLQSRRPLLHHLNADSSWLLQVPNPSVSSSNDRGYFNILIDPWLSGSQSDVASWFSQQWHANASSVPSIAAVESLIAEIEATGAHADPSEEPLSEGARSRWRSRRHKWNRDSLIDAIAISHEFTDHCHKATLLEAAPSVPVIAATKAAQLIKGWGHFHTILETPVVPAGGTDWRNICVGVLPEWLSISRIEDEQDSLYYHSAMLIAFQCGSMSMGPPSPASSNSSRPRSAAETDVEAEAVIYTPHGIRFASLASVGEVEPPIRPLALLHGLHDIDISWGQQLNLGAYNGLAAQRILSAKYWIGTHDEVKRGGGLVSWLLRRRIISVEDAVREERKQTAKAEGIVDVDRGSSMDDENLRPNFLELRNGESVILE